MKNITFALQKCIADSLEVSQVTIWSMAYIVYEVLLDPHYPVHKIWHDNEISETRKSCFYILAEQGLYLKFDNFLLRGRGPRGRTNAPLVNATFYLYFNQCLYPLPVFHILVFKLKSFLKCFKLVLLVHIIFIFFIVRLIFF